MTENKVFTWNKESTVSRTYGFQLSPKLSGKIKRKGLWSPDGSAELGTRKLRFRANGKAKMHLVIFDGESDKQFGKIDFYWKDFQRSKLELADGTVYHFKSFDLIRGAWCWIKNDSPLEQVIFRVDSPFQRSGSIESVGKEPSALERDILLLLGLHLQHYLNTWLMTIILVVTLIVTGH